MMLPIHKRIKVRDTDRALRTLQKCNTATLPRSLCLAAVRHPARVIWCPAKFDGFVIITCPRC